MKIDRLVDAAAPAFPTADKTMARLDLDQVRAEFPGLASDWTFLDNAGGSMVLRRVADRVRDYLLTSSMQPGASYAPSQAVAERLLAARRSVAELINAAHDDEVVMGGSSTGLVFMLTQAILPGIAAGDEIIVTDTDHEANIGSWMNLRRAGAVIKVWGVSRDSLALELDDLDGLLSPRVRWVAMTQASNVLGTVNPVEAVASRVHAAGGRLFVDAAAYAPHRLVDVQASGADACVFSFYKVFGPHQAALWGRRELLQALPGLDRQDLDPEALQPGGQNHELSYGCIGISDYLQAIGSSLGAGGDARQRMQAAFDAFEQHEDLLAERLLSFLRGKRNVRIIGLPTVRGRRRLPTISFTVSGQLSQDIVRHVDRFRIGIHFGDFHARRLIEALGLEVQGGVVRVSMAHYNTLDEIDRLVRHLDQIIA